MNPYSLTAGMRAHIAAVAKKSKVSRVKRHDIQRELTAFAEDYARELHFDGKDASEIEALVIEAIGAPEQRGKEFTIANRTLARVPWIGTLFYDDALQTGIILFLLQLSGIVVFVVFFLGIESRIVSYIALQYNIIQAGTFLIWLLYGFVLGMYTRLRLQFFWKSFDAVIASMTPVILFFVAFVANRSVEIYVHSATFRLDSLYYSVFFLLLYPSLFCGIVVPYNVVKKFQRKSNR